MSRRYRPRSKTAATTTTTQTPAEASIAKLQEAVVELTIHPATVHNGTDYSKEFNAAFYYIANPDLQTAIGVKRKDILIYIFNIVEDIAKEDCTK